MSITSNISSYADLGGFKDFGVYYSRGRRVRCEDIGWQGTSWTGFACHSGR